HFLILRRRPSSTLFPYTTLFRSEVNDDEEDIQQYAGHDALDDGPRRRARDLLEPQRLRQSLVAGHHGDDDAEAAGFQRQQREVRSEEHTSELQSLRHLVCRLLLE